MRHRVRQGGILLVAVSALALLGCAPEGEHRILSAGDLQDGYRHVSGYGPAKSSSGSFLAAYRARVTNDLDAEVRFLKEALEAAPDSAELKLRLFYATMAAGRVEEAVELVDSLPPESDGFNRVRLTRIVEAIRNGEEDVAELVEGFPDNHFSRILKPLFAAWLSAGRDDTETVQAALEPLKNPDRPLLLYTLHTAYILDVIGQSAEAAEFYEKVWEKLKDPPSRWMNSYGRHFEFAGDVEAAKKTYTDYLQDNDSPIIEHALKRLQEGGEPELLVKDTAQGIAEALYTVASSLRSFGPELRSALFYGHLAVRLRPDLDAARIFLGDRFQFMGRHDAAINAYEQVGKDSPYRWEAQLGVAESLRQEEREEDAIALYNSLASERPDRYSPLVALANHHRFKKEYENAVAAYDRALARIPEFSERHWSVLFGRGMAFERLKKWEQAEKDFLEAMELSPNQPLLLNYLGYSWVDQGTNLERGLKLIKQAVAARPNSGFIVDSLGWAYYRLKDYQKAVTQLERAVELRPHDPTINDHLGDAYWRVGREVEARYQWKKALSFDPEEDMIPAIRKKVREGLPTADDS